MKNRPHFITGFAVVCVAVTTSYVMWLGYRLNETLSGPGWCATALGAGKASSKDGNPIKGLEACVGLLTIQLKSLSTNSHILLGTVALCLIVLIVIVVAGAKLAGKVSDTGAEINVSRDDPSAPAPTVTTTTTVTPPPPPPPTGPAMPQPPQGPAL